MYLIVAFEDNTTGPVAKEWFCDGLAWWPPLKDKFKLLQAVQKRLVPESTKGWKQFPARVLYESESIQNIQAKWEMSCVTSDLNTDKEQDENKCRKRKKPARIRSPSPSTSSTPPSEEEDLSEPLPKARTRPPPKTPKRMIRIPPKKLSSPPLLPLVIKEMHRAGNTTRPQSHYPGNHLVTENGNTTRPQSESSGNHLVTQHGNTTRPQSHYPRNHLVTQHGNTTRPQSESPGNHLVTQHVRRSEEMEAGCSAEGLRSPEVPRSRLSTSCQLVPATCSEVERLLLEQLGELHLKVDHLTTLIQSQSVNRGEDQQRSDYEEKLPIATLEDLDNFDEMLRQDPSFKKQVIAKLSITEGSSVKKTVWRVCKKVFTAELATQLNWCGRGPKTGIQSRPVRQILLAAVLRNDVTEAEVEGAIKNWLRLSKDRMEGRRRNHNQ